MENGLLKLPVIGKQKLLKKFLKQQAVKEKNTEPKIAYGNYTLAVFLFLGLKNKVYESFAALLRVCMSFLCGIPELLLLFRAGNACSTSSG